MVIRVCAVLVCLALGVSTMTISQVAAGGPPACYPAPYPCAPPACAPPTCGPPSPFTLCGGILGVCSSICGTCIGLPAAVMGGLLAPPPIFRPARCAPPCPPPCAPPVACPPAPVLPPAGITKCKPTGCQPVGPAPVWGRRPVPWGPPLGYGAPHAPTGLGYTRLYGSLIDMPARLVSGVLSCTPLAPVYGPFAATSGGACSSLGTYW